jgi:predicted kinase
MTFHHIFDGGKDIKNKLISMSFYPMSIKEHLFMNIADKKGTVNETETDDFIKAHFDKIKSEADELGIFEQPYLFKTTAERRLFFNPKANIDTPKFTMYVMIGLPGSGKNYYIEKFLSTVLTISRDDIRTKIGIKGEKPQGNKEQEEYVTQIFNDEVIKCCKEQKDFVINNTNVKRQYRDGYKRLVKQYNPKVVYILMETNIKTCKERREGLMPMSVIDNMSKNFEYPHPSEYDKILIV